MALLTQSPPPPARWVVAPPKKSLVVGMGDMLASNDAQASLVTYSLGSCVGVAIYDPMLRVGGMLHAMLPDSTINPERAASRPFMFVDTGLPALFHAVYALGAIKHRLVVKLAGGAQFLDEKKIFNIGERNSLATLALLARNDVAPTVADCGGQHSRTLRLDLGTGALTLEVPGEKAQTL
jgi:chemotaxis protein CheD